MTDIEQLAQAVLSRHTRLEKLGGNEYWGCRYCWATVFTHQDSTDIKHAEDCVVLLARKVLNGEIPRTHFHLTAAQIQNIEYDYEGPGGCQRKKVYADDGTYVYHQIGNDWAIQTYQPK